MASLKVFFGAYKYLTQCVKISVDKLNRERLKRIFELLIENRSHNLIVDGQGRSLQSILLMEDCMEHMGFPIIIPASNANLRPWHTNDTFFFNSGSGSGSTIQHALAAKKDGLHVMGMTYNAKLVEEFPDLLLLTPSKNNNPVYAPLGTEFELTSAVIGAILGSSVKETPEKSLEHFDELAHQILTQYAKTYEILEEKLEWLMDFINLISDYVPSKSKRKVYFQGVGRDAIINRVAAIRYGHLHKDPDIDLKVIYEGHWDLREAGDLAIITSGSGSTRQTLDYGMQSFVSGLRVFGITSFENSDLGRFCKRVDGLLVLPGRHDIFSMYNMPMEARRDYFPEFELNCYITLDSLLAQIASNFGVTEADMKASHRPKILE